MTETSPPTTHPVAAFGVRVHKVLDSLSPVATWSMTAHEQRTTLVALARAEARIVELRLRVLAAADRNDIAADSAASSTAAWVAHHTRQSRSAAHADLRFALSLDSAHQLTRAALADGLVDQAQARIIVDAVEALPDSVPASDRERAEKHLVDLAGEHDAKALRVLGRRAFEVIDPDAADAEEGRRLEAEERAAQRATYLHLSDNGDGTHTGRFKIPSLHAAMLRKMLHAIVAPRRNRQQSDRKAGSEQPPSGQAPAEPTPGEPTPGEPTLADPTPAESPLADDAVGLPSMAATRPERMGAALCDLLERFPASKLPQAGGVSATVLVLLDYHRLLSGLGAVELDTGAHLRRTGPSAGLPSGGHPCGLRARARWSVEGAGPGPEASLP
jgi:hypothetical protein